MKLSIRLSYMWEAFIDVIRAIGSLLLKVGIPVIAILAYIYIMNVLPWWVIILISLVIILSVYLWIRAENQYKKDYETSKEVLYDSYHNFTDRWIAMERSGQSYNVIFTKMIPLMDEFEALVEYHKELYGEDDIYKLYYDRIDRFTKYQEEAEKNKSSNEGVIFI